MSNNYNNFGVTSTPVGTPSDGYGSFGVINSNLNGLSTLPNIVTESVSPRAFVGGVISGDLKSANYRTGVSGWAVKADGSAEFQSVTGLTFTGSTITGATITGSTISGTTITGGTFKTSNTTTRVEINGTDNALYFYNSGNIQLALNSTGLNFLTPLGISSATIQGFGTNDLMIVIAGSLAEYHMGTAALYQSAGADLGTSSFKWGTVYATVGTINTSDIRIKTNVKPLNYGLKEIIQLEPIRYDMYKYTNRLGFSAQAVSKIIPEVTTNCEEDSVVGTAGLCPTDLIPVLVNALKELKLEVDDLRRQITKNMV